MAGFWDVRRMGASGLCLLLWAFLLSFENAQSLHEFKELSIHGSAVAVSSPRVDETAKRGHDCHRCLVSHPKTFAGLTLDRSAASTLRVEEACSLPNVQLIRFLQLHSPNKRSPPA